MKKINIAIDGYAGCGKSTTAKAVAKKLGYLYIDSGSMYRAFTWHLLNQGVNFDDVDAILEQLADVTIGFEAYEGTQEVTLNGEKVGKAIRSLEVSDKVSEVSTIKDVRRFMVAHQQSIGINKGIVMDGRDIGTVVFPKAELKIFMQASFEVRVARRILELQQNGQTRVTEEEVKENLRHRDYLDTTRAESPLRAAPDARLLDTTFFTFEQQVEQLIQWAEELITEPVINP